MTRATCRRANLGDLMVLIVVAAIGLSSAPAKSRWASAARGRYAWLDAESASAWIDAWSPPWLVPTTCAVLAIRLRTPRPSWRRLGRQPGFLAVAWGTFLLILAAIPSILPGILPRVHTAMPLPWTERLPLILDQAAGSAGPCLVGGWLALLVFGRPRRESGWIDGLGILVGCLWTLRYFLHVLAALWTGR